MFKAIIEDAKKNLLWLTIVTLLIVAQGLSIWTIRLQDGIIDKLEDSVVTIYREYKGLKEDLDANGVVPYTVAKTIVDAANAVIKQQAATIEELSRLLEEGKK